MNSDEIIEALELQAKLLELHGENSFKTRAFSNAAFKLNKMRYDFSDKTKQDVDAIEGIGKSISQFIEELRQHGSAREQDELLERTPEGVVEIMQIKGLGPKKVHAIWKELGCETVGELLYACNENRLASLKGFGAKTQASVKENIEFRMLNSSKKHYAALDAFLETYLKQLKKEQPHIQAEFVGDFKRKCEVLDKLEILSDTELPKEFKNLESQTGLPVVYHICHKQEFVKKMFELTATKAHAEQINFPSLAQQHFNAEEDIYKALHLSYMPPETREGLHEVKFFKHHSADELIEMKDLKGILHNHTTYSDGLNTLKEMATYCHELGYEYLGICDHSKTASYAGGLNEERIDEQHAEMDELNKTFSGFRILKGIESDILSNGSLDYHADTLKLFDFVVASVHSNLKMTEEKANERLIKAIENPYTSILGHPTGRLLLARPGYPIDHKKIIDACAANGVSIELNAHPYRLDIDWRWIYYCMEKEVMVSINPDAHHKEGYHDMYYGVCVARKGLLTKNMCLNALSLNQLLQKFKK
jgi:DNA polymerase (family X)